MVVLPTDDEPVCRVRQRAKERRESEYIVRQKPNHNYTALIRRLKIATTQQPVRCNKSMIYIFCIHKITLVD